MSATPKLTEADVRLIRKLLAFRLTPIQLKRLSYWLTIELIATIFDVEPKTIALIKAGKRWKNIE